MKFARYEANGQVRHGIVEGETVTDITAPPIEDYEVTATQRALSDVRLLSPIVPGKILAIGLNYRSHVGDREPPKVPEPFIKTPSSLIGPGDDIVLPRDATVVHEEAELAVVIGSRCKNTTRENALDYVLGYTCGNDVSERS